MPDPFEGPEKLLELWFAPTDTQHPDGLRSIPRKSWEDMLDIVRCKVLSVVNGKEVDAYLLSESSLFIAKNKLILKTCGTTLNLYGLPRILEIAASAGLPKVDRCFYSRKSFMFPELQEGPHKDWRMEVDYLDKIFTNGAAYTIGKMNGDHWLLYITEPEDSAPEEPSEEPSEGTGSSEVTGTVLNHPDYTIEILMSGLSAKARDYFSFPDGADPEDESVSLTHGLELSKKIGVSDIFPQDLTTLDAFSFVPCGYSSNALIKWGEESLESDCHSQKKHSGEGYYTIHVTPEEGWSYASFECNVPLSVGHPPVSDTSKIPTLQALIKRVVNIFQPSRLTLTLFISTTDSGDAVEIAQQDFATALHGIPESSFGYPLEGPSRRYKRTDKINYEFAGYDLAFASFELK